MVASAGIYTNSLHRKIFPQQGEHALLNVSRWASVAFALIVIPLSYQFTDMPGAMRFLFKTVPLMGIAFVLAVLWRRANRYGAVASFLVATGALLFTQYILKWRGDQGLPSTILLYVSLGTLAGFVVSLLTPPEDAGRTNRFFLLMRTRIGNEQVLRDAGLVEIPGTGTFEDPILDGSCELPMPDNAGATRIVKPSKETLYGFLVVGVIALALLGFVAALATWLEQG
jgi:hypothetical protein